MMFINISDIHFLNREVPSWHIVESLEKMLTVDLWKQADGLFITGDIFDRLVSASDLIEKYVDVYEWMKDLLLNSKKYNTPIRIVKGTPFHDWNMPDWIVHINESMSIGADVRYYKDVHLEYDTTFDMWIGYIPDAIRPKPEMVYDELVEKMKTLGCDKIHFILAHGFFDFQNTHDSPAYDTVKFSELVQYAIYCGHDHIPKSSMKVNVPGSVERTRYGEEHPKGMLVTHIIGDVCRTVFVENKNAANIRAVDLTKVPDQQLMDIVESEIRSQMHGRTGYLGKLKLYIDASTELRKQLERIARGAAFKLDFEFKKDETEKEEKREQIKKFSENLVQITDTSIEDLLLAEVACDTDRASRIIRKIKDTIK